MLRKMFLSKKRKGTQETLIPDEVINLHSFIYIHINAPKTEVLFHILWVSWENDTDLLISQINFTLKIKYNLQL